MDTEKRDKQPPIPDKYEKLLTDEQLIHLRILEQFGWYIYFIRRPLFQEVTVVLENYENDADQYRWLRPDGTTSRPFFDIREEDYE